MTEQKKKCRGCGKSTGRVRDYIIADNLEEPKPYHKNCYKRMMWKVLLEYNKFE